MKKTRRYVALGLIVLGAVVLALVFEALGGITGVRDLEDKLLDLRQQTTAESFQPGMGERESEVVLVLFDELTVMDPEQGWGWISPFPRSHLAELIDALALAGARTIGVDVFLDQLFPRLNEIDGGNELLRDAMERAGNVVLVTPIEQTDSGPVSSPPHPYFAQVAAGIGSAELPSPFETFRDGALAVRSGGGLEPSFALAMYAHSRALDVDSLLAEATESGRIELPGMPPSVGLVPSGWFGEAESAGGDIVPFRIRYVGPPSSTDAADPPGTFQATGSGSASLAAMLMPELFRDKIVLLGTGFHAEDKFRTPFYGSDPHTDPDAGPPGDPYTWMYGVEIHANSLQNILDGQYVTPIGRASKLLMLILVSLLTGGVAFWKGAGWGAVATVLTSLGATAYAFWAWAGLVYLPGGELMSLGDPFLWVPIVTPVLAGVFSYVESVAYVSIVEGKEKRFIKGAFGKYVSPQVVAEIAEDPEALKLGGQKRLLSLLFSDLSGFTTVSERMDPEDLLALLNEYLDDMTDIVLGEDGTLDKYIGDAIMAFWNAPKDVPDHAERAMRTAVIMQRKMNELNERWRADDPDHESLKVRIGIHTGEVVVGNVGGEDRFDYSAIGDAVNLAARLEPANKTYDTLNMVSEITLDAAGSDRFRVRELDYIAVKGKREPVKVYELMELAGVELEPERERAIERYEEAMKAYKKHEWSVAAKGFEAALSAWPDDGPSAVYVERCREHIADPPPPDWDFVVRRTAK